MRTTYFTLATAAALAASTTTALRLETETQTLEYFGFKVVKDKQCGDSTTFSIDYYDQVYMNQLSQDRSQMAEQNEKESSERDCVQKDYEPMCENDFIWCYCTNDDAARTADGEIAYKQVANKTRKAGGVEPFPLGGIGHKRVDNSEFSSIGYTSPEYKNCAAYAKSRDAQSKGIKQCCSMPYQYRTKEQKKEDKKKEEAHKKALVQWDSRSEQKPKEPEQTTPRVVPFLHTSPYQIDENIDAGWKRQWDPFWQTSPKFEVVERPEAWSLANPDANPIGLSLEKQLQLSPSKFWFSPLTPRSAIYGVPRY